MKVICHKEKSSILFQRPTLMLSEMSFSENRTYLIFPAFFPHNFHFLKRKAARHCARKSATVPLGYQECVDPVSSAVPLLVHVLPGWEKEENT